MRSVLLIRHGQASFGAADYDRLSDTGCEQSRRLGAWLASSGERPGQVVCGPRERHRRTAELCLAAAGIEARLTILPGLDELDHVEVIARHRPDLASPAALRAELERVPDPRRAFQRLFVDAIARWVDGTHDADYARPWPAFRAGALAALEAIAAQPTASVWAFTSGGPIAVIASHLFRAPAADALKLSWPLVNTSLTRVRLDTRQPAMVTYNAWPHLARAEDAHLLTLR